MVSNYIPTSITSRLRAQNHLPLHPYIKRILLAEDDDDDFNLFNSALLSLYSSIEVLRTKNGIMLSSLIETSIIPDIIVLDLNMPFKNGATCLQEIKSKEHLKEIKVIIYTTSGNTKEIEACYNAGADFYLVKPVSFPSIIQQFNDLFNNQYFITNTRPPRNQFVIGSSNPYIVAPDAIS
jgi:CheY-like chemotaxis protein